MNTAVKLFYFFMLTLGINHATLASGGGSSAYTPAPVDQTYEAGKAIFKGRTQQHSFCLFDNNTKEFTKIKRKTIKAFKKRSADALTNHLYACESPNPRANTILNKNDLGFLIYYLNKRFSLKLS